ncbi:MAG: sodium:solute symporter family protein [Candidatus Eremiobacteraeota bacterium]|nr:sodium:solute symporter family protein [Candidatus Eremiobacteraeota bacterium]
MSSAAVALTFVGIIVLCTILFALYSVRRISSSPEQFIVGGRSFGTLLLWILMAGEIYTSFTFLGAAGWAYGRGAPALYILAYGTVGYIVGFFFLPGIWRLGKDHGLLTAPDLYLLRYGSKRLSTTMALVQALLLIPYISLQLGGLQKLLTIAGYDHINASIAVMIGFLLVTLFVFSAGLHGTAWASVIKDSLVLAAVLFAGIAIPMHFFGSIPVMMDRLLAAHPHWLTLKPGIAAQGEVWFISTVLLTGIGFFSGPQNMNATFSARHGDAIRRNMIFLPLYQLILLFIFFAGFAALLIVPGSKDPDLSFMLLLQKYYPPWLVGAIAGAGALAALLPASALLLCAASLIAKNVLGDAMNIATGDRPRVAATRALILTFALLAMALWLAISPLTLVQILLYYYNGITQFMPGYVFALVWRERITTAGVAAGLVAGFGVVFFFALTGQLAWFGMNAGFVALATNTIVCIGVSLVFPKTATGIEPPRDDGAGVVTADEARADLAGME